MTAERRVERLESGLPPKEATLLWLAEAHGSGSLAAYCGWLVDRPMTEAPLERIRAQAVMAVRQAMRGESLERLWEAEGQVERDVAFLFELVMVLNATAEGMVRVGGLRYGMLFWEARAIGAEARDEDRDGPSPTIAERWVRWHASVAALRSDLSLKARAFGSLEGRYLDGHTALFADTVERWQRLSEAVEDLAYLGGVEDSSEPGRGDHAPPDQTRIDMETEAGRILDEVRAHALDILGDVEGSAAMLATHLRGTT